MFVSLTIIYILVTYIGQTVYFLANPLMPIITVIRELYLVFMFFYSIRLLLLRGRIKISKQNLLLLLLFCLSLPYLFISGNIRTAFSTYLLFYSGPLLFFFITNSVITQKQYISYKHKIRRLLNTLCILGFFFFFIQEYIITLLPERNLNFYYFSNEQLHLRLLGIGLHPTSTGFLYLYAFAMNLFYGKKYKSIFDLFCVYLAHTRSAILGLPLYIVIKVKKILKFLSIILIIICAIKLFNIYKSNVSYNKLDSSATTHLEDLFVYGPQYVAENIQGIGLGTVSPYNKEDPFFHLESDLYLYIIQVGIVNFLILIIILFEIVKKLMKTHNKDCNYLLLILLSYICGCVVFPIHGTRFISNFVWIELGLFFVEKKNVEKCNYISNL